MKVYELRAESDEYQCLIMTDGDLYEFASRFNGTPMTRPWADVRIEVYSEAVPKGDYPSLIPNVPIFSRRAVAGLSDLLQGNGEILPIMIGKEEYYLYNVTRVVDALDRSRSEVITFGNGSRVLNIRQYAFSGSKLSGLAIFKIPETDRQEVLVTEIFVDRVLSRELKGFWFIPVWTGD